MLIGICQTTVNDAIEYSGPSGSLTSPNYPSSYSSNQNCYWKISVPSGLIKITFVDDFHTETNDDYLYVSENALIRHT